MTYSELVEELKRQIYNKLSVGEVSFIVMNKKSHDLLKTCYDLVNIDKSKVNIRFTTFMNYEILISEDVEDYKFKIG